MKKFRIFGFLTILIFMFTACFGKKTEELTGIYKEVDDLLKEVIVEVTNKDKFWEDITDGIQDLTKEEEKMIEITYELLKTAFDTADYKIEKVVEEGDDVIATLKVKAPKNEEAVAEISRELTAKKEKKDLIKLNIDINAKMNYIEEVFRILIQKLKDKKVRYSDEIVKLVITRKDGKLDKNISNIEEFLDTVTGLEIGKHYSVLGM